MRIKYLCFYGIFTCYLFEIDVYQGRRCVWGGGGGGPTLILGGKFDTFPT